MRKTPSPYRPDTNLPGVGMNDIEDNAIESRHISDSEILPRKMATVEGNMAVPFVIQKAVTTGAALVSIFNANAPFKLEILDVAIQCRNASANGTMKATDGTNDITDAIVCASAKAITRAGTIDNAYSTIAKGGSLEISCAGDTVADTQALVTILAVKVD